MEKLKNIMLFTCSLLEAPKPNAHYYKPSTKGSLQAAGSTFRGQFTSILQSGSSNLGATCRITRTINTENTNADPMHQDDFHRKF